MAGSKVTKISYYEIVKLLGPNKWRCHVYTDDDSHYEGEGYTKTKRKRMRSK